MSATAARFRAVFTCLLVLSPSVSPLARADITPHLSGFGSVGAGRILTRGGEFEDYTTDWSFDNDTVIGVQLDLTHSRGVTFTTQAVARGYDVSDVEASYDAELELMFLAYQATDNLRVRGGLIRTPFFIHSESIEVGYAYPWVRPPVDVYSPHAQAVTHMKGVDASYYLPVNDALLEVRLVYGTQDARIETPAFSYDIDLEPLMGTTLSLNRNEWLFRYSLYRTSSTFSSAELSFVQGYYRGWAGEVPIFDVLARNVGGRNQTTVYQVFGMQYESDGWTVTSEIDYEKAPEKQFSVGLMGGYLSVAKQMGQYSPYVLLSYTKSDPSNYLYSDLAASENVVEAGENVLLDLIRTGNRQAFDAVDFSNHRQALGLRYDVSDSVDIKAELEYFSIDRKTNPGSLPDDQTMLTLVLDWVL